MALSNDHGFIDRIYPLDGGLAFAPNKAMYSPGHFEGETVALSCNAFLVQRGGEWLLWDTGISESLFDELGGEVIAHGIRGIVARPITHQLAGLGLTSTNISKVILLHAHFDHMQWREKPKSFCVSCGDSLHVGAFDRLGRCEQSQRTFWER